jgi:hypothetical protein
MRNLIESELTKMPFYNLAKTVDNKWLQQFGNWGNDLYITSIDDFVRVLIQVSRYYQYLKGEHAGTSPGKEELMLQVAQRLAQRSKNPKALNIAMTKMPGAEEFCTREPYFKNEEVFGSQKRKADIPFGSEYESHRLDIINFSRPQVNTRSTSARGTSCSLNDLLEEFSPDLHEHPIPIDNCRTTHVTTIQEIAYKETE